MAKTDSLTDFSIDLATTIRKEENSDKLIPPKNFPNKIPLFGKRLEAPTKKLQNILGIYGNVVSDTDDDSNIDEEVDSEKVYEGLEGVTEFLTDIANSIRAEEGSTSLINPQNFSIKVSGFGNTLKEQRLSLESALGKYKDLSKITYGVKLDKSILLGADWASYTDDAEEQNLSGAYMDFTNDVFVDNGWKDRWPFNEIKPCLMKNNQVVGYLDPNDYTKFEDGTDSNITNLTLAENGFVMVEIPKIYYHISRDDSYVYIKISNYQQPGFVCKAHTYKGVELDKLYISAYLCGASPSTTIDESLGFITPSGATLSQNVSISYRNNWATMQSLHGDRYEMLPYNVTILIECLFAIMFKSTNSQASLGYGYTSRQAAHTVGKLDKMGMYYGKGSEISHGVKFLGLEDIYGTREQVSTGFYVRNSIPSYIDVSDSTSSYSPDVAVLGTYIPSEKEFVIASKYSRATTDVNEDAVNVGLWGKEVSTNYTHGFCDAINLSTNCTGTTINSVLYGLVGSTNTYFGIFAQQLTIASNTSKVRSLRIVYYPQP